MSLHKMSLHKMSLHKINFCNNTWFNKKKHYLRAKSDNKFTEVTMNGYILSNIYEKSSYIMYVQAPWALQNTCRDMDVD